MQRWWVPVLGIAMSFACGGQTTDVRAHRTPDGGASSVGGAGGEHVLEPPGSGGSLWAVDSGSGAGATDAGSPPITPCLVPPGHAPNVSNYVMYDASASAAGQDWRVDVIRALVNGPPRPSFIADMQYFPIGDDQQVCTASYDIPYAHGDLNDVLRGVDGLAAAGPRALGPAYAGAIRNFKERAYQHDMGVVVLVTTGAPEACSPSSYSELVAMATKAVTTDPMVRTAIVGPSALPPEFDDVAKAGLTEKAFRVSATAEGAQAAAAFLHSLREWGECAFDLNNSIGLPAIDVTTLVVTELDEQGSTVEVPRVGSMDDCGSERGWYSVEGWAYLCAGSCSLTRTNPVSAYSGCNGIGSAR